MSDQDALLRAIIANPDDDTPRLVYADWLDENLPDKRPSPAAGPSARADYIRVQCRLAGLPFHEPDYPELLEREEDLATWLNTHTPHAESEPDLPADLQWLGEFDNEEWQTYQRGFPEECEYTDFEDDPTQNVERILEALPEAFARSTTRSLRLEDAYGGEIADLLASPVVAGLRGLSLCDIADDNESYAVRALATSPHLGGLRRLYLDFNIAEEDLRLLTRESDFHSLTSLSIDYPTPVLKPFGAARWFRNLRSLHLWLDDNDALKFLAELPVMPNLLTLKLSGAILPPLTTVRKFAASETFPRLARLEFSGTRFTPEMVVVLARGEWPLRCLKLDRISVRKAGAEALAAAPFAESLRVLSLSDCEITTGGVQAMAASGRLAGLRHLNLSKNPIGAGGLAAIARSPHLRGLSLLDLSECNSTKAPLDAVTLLNFLSAVEMPELRHLKLDKLPVAVRGARALVANPTCANLTRLSLAECGLRENGARAIVESRAMPNLTVLSLPDNSAGKGVSKLADAKVFPRLGSANVSRNRISKWPLGRLRKRAGVQV